MSPAARTTLPPEKAAAMREAMVERHIAARGVRDEKVLAAMREVPRELFVPPHLAEAAYEDMPLPIAAGQTISQPFIVAEMVAAVEPKFGDRALDVGTGSGYAAAVLSRIVEKVLSIERWPELAQGARDALEAAEYDNVQIEVGDGTLGMPERAPFDVILVAAGGPRIPKALLDQLAPGGRLVMPVGERDRFQSLIRIRKDERGMVKREDLGAVAFVPLVGAEGWSEGDAPGERPSVRPAPASTPRAVDAPSLVAERAEPLPPIEDEAFGAMFDRIGDARVVLLGEATHGTSEFYRARAEITKRLVERHGFDTVAVEADWPDAAAIDRHVRGLDGRRPGETHFARFPTWMWRNAEMRDFVDWMKTRNRRAERKVSFHGLDLYSLSASIEAVLRHLDEVDPETAEAARERYGCLTPWRGDPASYGRAALRPGFRTCEEAVVTMLRELLEKRLDDATADGDAWLDATQNARLIANAEAYYRAIYYGGADSWNLRDRHMFETLRTTLAARGPNSKAVVWAHNSHIGDARATEMGESLGELNIGQLCREFWGEAARLVGFGTDRGTVAAATDWDGPTEIKQVRPAMAGSVEALTRDAEKPAPNVLLDLRPGVSEPLREALAAQRLERAIGVIYRPESERASHYFDAALSRQFDIWVWFEETKAVTELGEAETRGAPDTWPFGV